MNVRQLAARVEQGRESFGTQDGRRLVPPRGTETSFERHLAFIRRAAGQKDIVARISDHAWQRIEQRGIAMTPDDQQSLGKAMLALEEKGSRDALLMRSDAAFVVNVPNRTVVTALDRQEMHARVFTQIDSAMLLDQ